MRGRDGPRGAASPAHPRGARARCARRGGKAIVLVNRRGWAPYLTCRSCGWAWRLPELRRLAGRPPGGRAAFAATTAATREPLPERLPRLRLGDARPRRRGQPAGRGARSRPRPAPLPVFRLDSDTAARAGGHLEILARFQAAEAGVLVGTQMVAKGHDFHDVVLGVVLDADSTLRFPDLRAEERTFALVAQLAGRSGRGERRGPGPRADDWRRSADAIAFAARHDAAGFLAGELERRRELALPAVRAPDPDRALGARRRGACRRPAARLRERARRRAAGRRRGARPGAALSASRPRAPPDPDQGARARAGGRRGPRDGPRRGRGARRLQGIRIARGRRRPVAPPA